MAQDREIVIQAKNLGIAFSNNVQNDDYKSHAINIFKKGKKEKKINNKTFWPIRNINFTAYNGEVLGIVGSNGSGKTTLCKLLSGIMKPDEGELEINGKVSALFSLGMGFNRSLSGRENVLLNGLMMGMEKDKILKMVDEIHQFSGLGEFFEQPMKKYSSGMRARLGFSVASHLDPEILILDESLNTGDRAFAKKASTRIKELVGKAKLVIIVTHSHKFAKKSCDRLIWLEKGEIREIGDPETVLEHYEATIPKGERKPRRKLKLKNIDSQKKDRVIIDAQNVSINFRFGRKDHWALKDISFKINEGEVIGIIGHNGAGKSTLCKVLTKILKPDEGELAIRGKTTALLNYGTGFNAHLSGRDNILLNGMLLGIPKDVVQQNILKIAEFAELENVLDQSIKRYSSGMRARLGFSIAATLQPDIFIIDEALSTGDVSFQQKASEKIQDMMEEAKAVIIVSHSMSFVEKVCTRAIWLENGRLKKDGPSAEVVEAYRSNSSVQQDKFNK
ncbi:ABC transporter ATP-binding protein [Amphibacillus sediminis]|uniref:ABC transporter ATP-binding protein n=1 Tax=Amphibacillus sediminis TaxID=360185 RepID=UPI000AD05CD8|nr:ATP-binding cassette domain-containing protein [Amphibacillus sediminis]